MAGNSVTSFALLAAMHAAVLAAVLGGCTVISSSGRDDPIPCAVPAVDAPDPCPDGLECRSGLCQDPGECVPTLEVCNNEDDDCDGAFDEGFDADGDGWSTCNLADPTRVDCVDSNPAIHPPDPATGEPREVCDGADNDCDSIVDEAWDDGTQLCGPGEGCFPDQGGCVFIDCRLPSVGCPERHACQGEDPAVCVLVTEDCTVDGCMTGQRCDPRSLMCIEPLPVGASCDRDEQCLSNHCFSTSSLSFEASVVSGATRICSAPCCSHGDCASDEACWAPGTGARGCVPRSLLTSGPQGDLTAQTCSNNATCVPERCGIVAVAAYDDPEIYMTACRAPTAGSGTYADTCTSGGDCRSGMCIGTSIGSFCTEACGSLDDCPDGFTWTGTCSYRAATSEGAPDWIQVCDAIADPPFWEDDFGEDGDSCSSSSECLERACLGGTCARTCCSDDQCGAGRGCQPVSVNGRWEMHCSPSS